MELTIILFFCKISLSPVNRACLQPTDNDDDDDDVKYITNTEEC